MNIFRHRGRIEFRDARNPLRPEHHEHRAFAKNKSTLIFQNAGSRIQHHLTHFFHRADQHAIDRTFLEPALRQLDSLLKSGLKIRD